MGKVTSLYREMRDAVLTDGVELSLAIRTVTANPAALLKLSRKGRVAEAADADLVMSDEKSLAIDMVMAKGTVMVSGGQAVVKGTFEG